MQRPPAMQPITHHPSLCTSGLPTSDLLRRLVGFHPPSMFWSLPLRRHGFVPPQPQHANTRRNLDSQQVCRRLGHVFAVDCSGKHTAPTISVSAMYAKTCCMVVGIKLCLLGGRVVCALVTKQTKNPMDAAPFANAHNMRQRPLRFSTLREG